MVDDEEGIKCDRCDVWTHLNCSDISKSEYDFLSRTKTSSILWYCEQCHKDMKDKIEPGDRMAEQAAKIETLTATVNTLVTQN